jgi:hypothetical protein
MDDRKENGEAVFTTTLPIVAYIRPASSGIGFGADWREFEQGPGYFRIPAGFQVSVRIRTCGDAQLAQLAKDLTGCAPLVNLILAENRNITDDGLSVLRDLPALGGLNLSSCSLTSFGLSFLKPLRHLRWLDISYCNRLLDAGLKHLHDLRELELINLQGCVKITNHGVAQLRRNGLTINR